MSGYGVHDGDHWSGGQTSEEFAEMLAQARELRLLRAVADAARELLRSNGDDEDWAALRVALSALDGSGES